MKDILITALKTAGAELLKYFGKPVETTQKESQSSVVTKADLKSDALIVKLITDKFPQHNIVSEEGGFINRNSAYTWVIDPLDGTSNFASAIPWFGVLIALFEDTAPLMGGAYLPVTDDLYFAESGKGAMKNGIPFSIDKSLKLKDSLVAFAVDFTDDDAELDRSLLIYKNLVSSARNTRATNCLIDFLNVAENKFGACINLNTKIWDIAALGLIISEAGGIMKETDGNSVRYNFNDKVTEKVFPVMVGSESIIDEIEKKVLKVK
jgi:myo-inositol-1(or 4)-monophosphatase